MSTPEGFNILGRHGRFLYVSNEMDFCLLSEVYFVGLYVRSSIRLHVVLLNSLSRETTLPFTLGIYDIHNVYRADNTRDFVL
jgi:hypothetical protein